MPSYTPKDALLASAKILARKDDLTARLKTLLDRPPRSKMLTVLKYAVYIVLLLNAGSLPFVWHIRVTRPVILLFLNSFVLRLKLVFASKKEQTRAHIAWAEGLSPVGANPFQFNVVYKRWASFDDLDMIGMHLSNSSYAKAYDSVRMQAVLKYFPAFCRSGGQLALGATHYDFVREIPPLARYEVRFTIGSWDHKWVYAVARFVTHPSQRQTKLSPSSSAPPTPNDQPTSAQNESANIEQAVDAIFDAGNDVTGRSQRAPLVESDGALLHCVAVSKMCFKLDRITVPPPIVIASEGFTRPSDDGDIDRTSTDVRSYSHTNPPPNWIKSQSLRVPPHGSKSNFRAFLRGKWRDVPEGERWWEDALGGPIEAKRQANLEIFEPLKLGLERARTMR